MFRRTPDKPDPAPAAPERVDSVLGSGLTWQGNLNGSGGVRIEGAYDGAIEVHGIEIADGVIDAVAALVGTEGDVDVQGEELVCTPGPDLAAKIRHFLWEKYPSEEWGIEDVLLVGHYQNVPMRRVAQDLGFGAPETDFYYAELSRLDSESWDCDGDLSYGDPL